MSQEKNNGKKVDDARREFLRKSVYAAYAAPVITALLVEQASAATSQNPLCADVQWAANHPKVCP
jgi:hypothetical protein